MFQVQPHDQTATPSLEFAALTLQGGGTLLAYQAGVYEALAEAGIQSDWTLRTLRTARAANTKVTPFPWNRDRDRLT
jgi:hypothetical protein